MKSTPVRVAGSILTKSMRVRTLSLSRTLMMWPSGLSSRERPEALVLGTSLRAWVRTPPSSLEFNSAHLYPWPSWSKALDLSPNLFGGVGSNPTGCIWTDWRNGSASDSSPEGYAFESRIGHRARVDGTFLRRHGPLGQAAPLQGLLLPPRHHGLHVPGRRLHARQRCRGRVLCIFGGVAQWQSVRFACGKPRVQTPAPPHTQKQLRGAMDSVSDFESGGCGFESRRSCRRSRGAKRVSTVRSPRR